jgi:predicted P-loop ATPase
MFFGILYRQDLGWFDDTMTESGDKDELLKLHQHWCIEWAEFERALGRKGNSKIKSFMTTKIDNFRPPYGRQTKAFPRRGVLVGSTNEQEF